MHSHTTKANVNDVTYITRTNVKGSGFSVWLMLSFHFVQFKAKEMETFHLLPVL